MGETALVAQETMVCAECGIPYCMPASKVAELRKSGESFYCPNGHARHFVVGKSAEQKEIERLKGQLQTWIGWHGEMVAQRDEARQAAKVCPYECGFVVRRKSSRRSIRFALIEHLHDVHGAELILTGVLVEPERRRELTA